jgi:hypothetical protein
MALDSSPLPSQLRRPIARPRTTALNQLRAAPGFPEVRIAKEVAGDLMQIKTCVAFVAK